MTTRIHARKLAAKPLLLVACLSWGFDPARAEVTDLVVTKSGENAVLTWTTGTPLFRVLRSESPDFFYGNRLAAQGLTAGTFTDVEALAHGRPSYYYLVLEDGQADPPGFILNPPRPVPFISMLTPDAGRVGDVVTIDGGNFSPDGSAMSVTFDGWPADMLTTSAAQLAVEVPTDALTGDVQVCVAGVCSNRVLFKLIVGPTFQDISSLAFEPGTGSLWVADRPAGAGRVYEITAAGAVFQRGSLARPILGHPSPADGTGRIYYGNSFTSSTNTGTIEYIDSATNAELFFDNAGDTVAGDPVWCRGIAANDLEPDVVYYLDGNDNDFGGANDGQNVRRIVRNALVHDISYGDQPFVFNDPAGARFDSAGNLYLTSTTAVYKILPNEDEVELVASGFTAAAGIDLTEDSGIPLLLVADEATGKIWLVNGETGDKKVVGSGFSGPVAVAFSENLTTGDLFYDVAEPTRVLRLPDPTVEFLEKSDVTVLLSKAAWDTYPSGNQRDPANPTDPPQIQVQVRVIDPVNPVGRTVYFRIEDPKDTSLYLNRHPNDNRPTSPAGTVTPSAVVGPDGIATAILTVDPQYAGNNYKIDVSLDAPPNFKSMGKSKTYTTKRRVYFEHDRMFKAGDFITQTSGPGAQVFVASPGMFIVNEDVHVISATSPETRIGEKRKVAGSGPGYIILDSPLVHTYEGPAAPPNSLAPFSFVGKVSAGYFDALPSPTKLSPAFDDPFVEWAPVNSGEGFVPFFEAMEGHGLGAFSFFEQLASFFFDHKDDVTFVPQRNHVHVVSMSQFESTIPPAPAVVAPGRTNPPSNETGIFLKTIQIRYPSSYQQVVDEVVAHELAHQFDVNAVAIPGCTSSPDEIGHDCLKDWRTPAHFCLMHMSVQGQGVVKFHKETSPSIDLLCIRGHKDDLNDTACSWPP